MNSKFVQEKRKSTVHVEVKPLKTPGYYLILLRLRVIIFS